MLLRRVARPMLAAIFIQGGIAALKSPQGHVQAVKPVLDAVIARPYRNRCEIERNKQCRRA